MASTLFHGESLGGVHCEQALDEVLRLVADVGPVVRVEDVVCLQYSPKHGLGVSVGLVERRVAAQQHEQDHAHRPQIHGLSVGFALENLRRDISGCSCLLLDARTARKTHGKAKVGDLERHVVVLADEQDVLRLDIPV